MRRGGFGLAGGVVGVSLLAAWSAGCEKRHEHVDVIEVRPERRVIVERKRHIHVERDRRHDDRHHHDQRDRDRKEQEGRDRERDDRDERRDEHKEHRYGKD